VNPLQPEIPQDIGIDTYKSRDIVLTSCSWDKERGKRKLVTNIDDRSVRHSAYLEI
jgi:hypothetical protein